MLLEQEGHAVAVASLFVGGQGEDEVAVGLVALLAVADEVGHELRGHGLVVGRPAPVEVAALLAEHEGIEGPVLAQRLHHVEMGEQQEGPAGPGAAQAGHQVALAGAGSQDLHVGGGKARGAQASGHRLGRGRVVPHRVGGVDVDELFEDLAGEASLGREGGLREERARAEEEHRGRAHRHPAEPQGGSAARLETSQRRRIRGIWTGFYIRPSPLEVLRAGGAAYRLGPPLLENPLHLLARLPAPGAPPGHGHLHQQGRAPSSSPSSPSSCCASSTSPRPRRHSCSSPTASGSIVSILVGGALTDHLGRRRTLMLSLFGSGVLAVAMGLAPSARVFVPLLLAFGFVADLYRPAASAIVGDLLASGDRATGYAALRLAVNMGFFVGMALGGFLADWNWRLLFFGDGAHHPRSTASWCSSSFPRPTPDEPAAHPGLPARAPGPAPESPWRDGVFLAVACRSVLFSTIFFTDLTVLPLTVTLSAGLSRPWSTGLLVGLNGLLIALFEISVVEALKRRRRLRVAALGAAVCGVGYGLTGLLLHWSWFLLVDPPGHRGRDPDARPSRWPSWPTGPRRERGDATSPLPGHLEPVAGPEPGAAAAPPRAPRRARSSGACWASSRRRGLRAAAPRPHRGPAGAAAGTLGDAGARSGAPWPRPEPGELEPASRTCPTMARGHPQGSWSWGAAGTTTTRHPPAAARSSTAGFVDSARSGGSPRPFSTTARTVTFRALQGLDGEQHVVEGAETRPGHHHRLEAQAPGQVGRGVSPRQRHQDAACSFHDARGDRPSAAPARAPPPPRGPGLAGALRRHRGGQGLVELQERPGQGHVGAPRGTARTSESAGSPEATPVSTGLKPTARTPFWRRARTRAAATTVLPTPVSVPVTRGRPRSFREPLRRGRPGARPPRCSISGAVAVRGRHQHEHVAQGADEDAVVAQGQAEPMADALAGREARLRRAIGHQLDPHHQAGLADLAHLGVAAQGLEGRAQRPRPSRPRPPRCDRPPACRGWRGRPRSPAGSRYRCGRGRSGGTRRSGRGTARTPRRWPGWRPGEGSRP